MDWLGTRLNYKTRSDWYTINLADLMKNFGYRILLVYKKSPSMVVMCVYSDHNWNGWLFSETSNLFWKEEKNARDCIYSIK
jgi:hypothetical protein